MKEISNDDRLLVLEALEMLIDCENHECDFIQELIELYKKLEK